MRRFFLLPLAWLAFACNDNTFLIETADGYGDPHVGVPFEVGVSGRTLVSGCDDEAQQGLTPQSGMGNPGLGCGFDVAVESIACGEGECSIEQTEGRIFVTPSKVGTLHLSARVTGNGETTDETRELEVREGGVLEIRPVDESAPFIAGERVQYTVSLTNEAGAPLLFSPAKLLVARGEDGAFEAPVVVSGGVYELPAANVWRVRVGTVEGRRELTLRDAP